MIARPIYPEPSKLTGHSPHLRTNPDKNNGTSREYIIRGFKGSNIQSRDPQTPGSSKQFYVQTDIRYGIGAALLQDSDGPALEPIEFASRKLHKNELNLAHQ